MVGLKDYPALYAFCVQWVFFLVSIHRHREADAVKPRCCQRESERGGEGCVLRRCKSYFFSVVFSNGKWARFGNRFGDRLHWLPAAVCIWIISRRFVIHLKLQLRLDIRCPSKTQRVGCRVEQIEGNGVRGRRTDLRVADGWQSETVNRRQRTGRRRGGRRSSHCQTAQEKNGRGKKKAYISRGIHGYIVPATLRPMRGVKNRRRGRGGFGRRRRRCRAGA